MYVHDNRILLSCAYPIPGLVDVEAGSNVKSLERVLFISCTFPISPFNRFSRFSLKIYERCWTSISMSFFSNTSNSIPHFKQLKSVQRSKNASQTSLARADCSKAPRCLLLERLNGFSISIYNSWKHPKPQCDLILLPILSLGQRESLYLWKRIFTWFCVNFLERQHIHVIYFRDGFNESLKVNYVKLIS